MSPLPQLLGCSAGRPAVLLDPWDYAAKVLDQVQPPMTDITALVSLGRRSAGLLRPDGLVFPLHEWFRAMLASHGDLRKAMGQRSRTAFALKTALADTPLRSAFRETVSALSTALPDLPLILALGGPAQWLQSAYESAHGSAPDDIDADMCEQAQVYLADLLREIGGQSIGGLFIDGALETADEHWLEAFTPVVNVCVHYRWSLGVTLRNGPGKAPPPVGWIVGHCPSSGLPCGAALSDEFWQAGTVLPAPADFYIGRPLPDAHPESVLTQLADAVGCMKGLGA
jgi:hypothetical protein